MTRENEVGKTRENEGTTESSREVSQCGNSKPGTVPGTGRDEEREPGEPGPAGEEEITELEWMRRHMEEGLAPQPQSPSCDVFRKTELHDRPSSLFTSGENMRKKKRRIARGRKDRIFNVPPEMSAFAESLFLHLDDAAEDLYHQVALVDEEVGKLDKSFRKMIRQLEWRIAELEERGRVL
jgi:HAMP domain-containing protein